MTPASSAVEKALQDAEGALQRLRIALEAEGDESDDVVRWRRMLSLVESHGGRVSVSEWLDFGRQCGYDTRGLGGFFRGAGASMRSEGDERVLTEMGTKYLDQFGRVS